MRQLAGTLIYDANDQVLVTAVFRSNPDGVEGRDITVLDHSHAIESGQTYLWGHDYIAGGSDDDVIFGQLGDDVIQGDGSTALTVGAHRDATNALVVLPSAENRTTDGDDYVEGGGGNDVIFGNLGQDDLIGGSSDLFGLTTLELRPDGRDLVFGGAGTVGDLARNTYGDTAVDGHAQDADFIAGDNVTVYRLVGASGAYLTFNYDTYTNGVSLPDRGKIIPRAIKQLDYTPGGADFNPASAATDRGGADELHGESGDDVIYGTTGDDVIFGESHDDDIVGGAGHDWIAAGTGDDGVLGDDGRIYTSRNGLAEPLYGLAAEAQVAIDTPGDHHMATLFVTGLLNKTVNLTPFNVDPNLTGQDPLYDPSNADDIVYGGLGNDFLHGGAGDDAMSGAEALATFYDRPVNPGHILGFSDLRADEFVAYDEFDPMRRIEGFFLNFDARDPAAPIVTGTIRTDGNDMMFGDLGNDWLVGGTGKDWLFGGFGADLMNVDDDHDTNAGANDQPDGPETSYEDYAFGGAGRDVMIANTGGDRLIDWAGEFNSYLVPFSPFGMSTITRAGNPSMQDFLEAMSRAAGADRTRAADTGADPARNGEPFGELGLVNHSDPWWQEQTGAPDDPQPGNTQGRKDVLRFADFNNGQMSGFSADSGTWAIQGGALYTSATTPSGDAVTVYHVGEQLPSYYELVANIKTVKPTAGWKANSYVIFDYFSPTDFKFAGLDMSTNKVVMGERTATGWNVTATLAQFRIWPDQYYNLLVAVNGLAVTVTIDNSKSFSYAFQPRMIDGLASNLNWGYVGFGSENARGYLDNIQVRVLERPFTLQTSDDFSDGVANLFSGIQTGQWQVTGGRYDGALSGGDHAMSLIDLGLPKGFEANSRMELAATLRAGASAGFVFDLYSATDFKYVLLDAAADRLVIGYRSSKGWGTVATFAKVFDTTRDYDLLVSLAGSTVSVQVDGAALVAGVFNAVVVDGKFGTMTKGGSASFDQFTLRTSDSRFREQSAESMVAATAPTASSASSAFVGEDQLAPIVAEAAARWSALVGAPAVQAALRRITFEVVDLKGLALAQTIGNVVLIDHNAAGHGWYVDPTPSSDAEFSVRASAGELRAQAASPALLRMDLLTVVMHELGHVLGFAHNADGTNPDVMTLSLGLGVRRLPISAGGSGTTAISGPVTEPIAAPPAEPISAPEPPPPPPPPPPTKPGGKKK
ncbi:MAG TPA: calcium-binding protein [Actinomycetota bacterium]